MKIRIRWPRRRREELLFLTSTPDWPLISSRRGDVFDKRVFIVTRREPTTPTALITGGVDPCWRVYGVDERYRR